MLLPPIDKSKVKDEDEYLVLVSDGDLYTWRVLESQPTLSDAENAIAEYSQQTKLRRSIYSLRPKLAYTC